MTGEKMIGPVLSFVFIAGGGWVTLEAVAQNTDKIEHRVDRLEDSISRQEVIDVKIEGVEKRLDKMEEIVGKMLDLQQTQAQNMASVCQATGATCSR